MRRFALLGVVACASSVPAPIPPPAPQLLPRLEAARDLAGVAIGSGPQRATVAIMVASWCSPCHAELAILAQLRARHPGMRVLGLDYLAFEEYDHRGDPQAMRAFAAATPWLRVVPVDEALFTALGQPPKIPTLFVFDREGALTATFVPPMPSAGELDRLLDHLGA